MLRSLKTNNLKELIDKTLIIFGSGSSCSELLNYLFVNRIEPRKISILDSFNEGALNSPFGVIEVTKMSLSTRVEGELIVASCQWNSIVDQWGSFFPTDYYIVSNEVLHNANAIAKLGSFYLTKQELDKILESRFRDSLYDTRSKRLFDLVLDLRCGVAEESFNQGILEQLESDKNGAKSKYVEVQNLTDFDFIIDGGIFDGNEIPELVALLNKSGTYHGFDPNLNQINDSITNWTSKRENVNLNNLALWNSTTTLRFESELGAASHMLIEEKRAFTNAKPIETVSIDEYFPNIRGKKCLMKLDIEGSEMKALEGGTTFFKNNQMVFAISFYHRARDLYEIPNFLMSLGKKFKYQLGFTNPTFIDWVLYAFED